MTPVYSPHFCTALFSRFNELNDDDDDDDDDDDINVYFCDAVICQWPMALYHK